MSFANPTTQGVDLQQAGLEGSYSWYLEVEGAWLDQSSEGSINIPWLLSISNSLGNAYTQALSENAVAYIDPEFGWEAAGGGQDIAPGQQMWMGGGTGGFIVSW